MPIRRACRSSPLKGVARKISTNRVISSSACIRPPTAIDLGVVVLPGQLGGLLRPDQGAPDARHLVGGHLLTVAGTTDDDARGCPARQPPPRLRGGRTPGSRRARRTRTGRGRPARGRGRSATLEVGLEVEAGMVAAEVHAHGGESRRRSPAAGDDATASRVGLGGVEAVSR